MPAESHTLRRRLLTWLLLPLLILFFLRGGYTYYYSNMLANRVYDRMLFTLTSSLSQQINYNVSSHRVELPQVAAELLMSDELDALYYAIRDAQGNIIDGERRMPALPTNPTLIEQTFFDSRLNDRNVRIAYLPFTLEHQPYMLEVAETRKKRSLLSREFQIGSLLPQALIIILTTIIVWFGIGKSLAPLKRLQKAVSERSHLDLSALREEDISAEVQPLIQSINDLMKRLDGRPRLLVTDNGPGIPREQRERVFERFYSLLGNGAQGSGLGLAIVREIARMHGAETCIDSVPNGTGTRVSVVF